MKEKHYAMFQGYNHREESDGGIEGEKVREKKRKVKMKVNVLR
jgi:hypothetical protein